jgi:hypothetical protein
MKMRHWLAPEAKDKVGQTPDKDHGVGAGAVCGHVQRPSKQVENILNDWLFIVAGWPYT